MSIGGKGVLFVSVDGPSWQDVLLEGTPVEDCICQRWRTFIPAQWEPMRFLRPWSHPTTFPPWIEQTPHHQTPSGWCDGHVMFIFGELHVKTQDPSKGRVGRSASPVHGLGAPLSLPRRLYQGEAPALGIMEAYHAGSHSVIWSTSRLKDLQDSFYNHKVWHLIGRHPQSLLIWTSQRQHRECGQECLPKEHEQHWEHDSTSYPYHKRWRSNCIE
jgi:hypothetical protein